MRRVHCGEIVRTGVRGIVASLVALALIAAPALAGEKQASFVVDGNTGAVLHDQQGDEPRYPASLTKMMTLYMVFEQIEAGQLTEDTMLTVSVACAAMAPSKLDLEVGERISLGNAVKAVVTKSANDMACALAEAVAGSERVFAQRMTKKARAIGMSNTTFRNASGLPDPGQITTARDMVTLGLRLRDDFPKHYPVFQLRSFSYGGKTYKSHNTLMNGFVGMDGIKTGYTRASGFNLVSSVQRDGKYLVGAVFGGVKASVRNAHMRMILFRALETASTQKTRKAGPALIAKAAPAKKPKPQAVAEAPTPPAVKEPAAKKPVPQPAGAEAKATTKVAVDKQPAVAEQPAQASEPAIKIAKVRPVMVAGETAQKGTGAAERPETAQAPSQPPFTTASATPRLALAGPPEAKPVAAPANTPVKDQKPENMEALIASAAPRAPVSGNTQVAALSAARAAKASDAAVLRPSVADTTSNTVEPAANPTPVAAADAPAEAAPSKPAVAGAGGYQIQVGAFASADECKRHLDSVRGRASDLLKDRAGMAEEATVNKKQVFRARFARFDSAGAAAACTALRQQKVDCMVLKAP